MRSTTVLHTVLPQGSVPPEWVHLVPAGRFAGVDGRGPYVLKDAQAVITASMAMAAGNRLVIDENHATDLSVQSGQPAPARGWITAMEARGDGVWGRVDWTAAGAQLVADRAYSGISPTFDFDGSTGAVLCVRRAALTNLPNLAALSLLHQQQGPGMDLEKLRKALGLSADADEATILAAAEAAAAARTAADADLARVAEAAGVTVAAGAPLTADTVVTTLQAQRRGQTDTALMAQQMVTLQTQVQQMQLAEATRLATAAVDGAISAGKPIPAVLRGHYIARHTQDPAAVQKELDGMPSLNSGGLALATVMHAQAAGAGLTADEMVAAKLMGMSVDAWKAEKTRLAGAA